ncbi:MAG: hypothetical protein H5T86_16445, partial [Armatimonadetes bacterium]|nr:hypothetical protein [Armatimonadota bacterium]
MGLALPSGLLACIGSVLLASTDGQTLLAPTLVAKGRLQQQLFLRLEQRVELPSRLTGGDLVWQKLIGQQVEGQPVRYVRVWIRPDGRGGAEILGRRGIEFEDLSLEVHSPKITWEPREYGGQQVSVPQRAEGPREKWHLVGGARKEGNLTLGCDLGSSGKFATRRATWSAQFHRWRYDPPAGVGDFSRPATHDFVVLYCVLDLTTSDAVAKEGEPAEFTPICRLGEGQPSGVFLLYRAAAFWQDVKKQFVH